MEPIFITFKSFFHLKLFWFVIFSVRFLIIENFQKLSVTQLIFCDEINLVSRKSFFSYIEWWWRCVVCTLSLSHMREVKYCGGEIFINQMKFLQGTSQSMMFPFILRISFVNLNQSAEDSCRFVPYNKIHF